MSIIVFVFGIYALFKGNVKVTSKREITKTGGRIIGFLCLLPFFVGLWEGTTGLPNEILVEIDAFIYIALFIAVALVIIFSSKKLQPSTDAPKQ